MQQNNHNGLFKFETIKKEISQEDENNKITKLAIGKPGGADFTGEKWELQMKIRCLMCNVEVDYSNDVINI